MPIDTQIQQRVDQLLMETGEYSPLELLLAEGRLIYSDYEAWMNGEIEYLEDVLFGDPEQISTMLQQAQDYVSKLPMLAPQQSGTSTTVFSRNTTIDTLFHKVYRKANDQPQMDLFFDAGASNLVNGVTLALSQNDIAEARRLLEQLYDVQPDNTKLNDLETLVKYAEQPIGINRDIADELGYLQNQLGALAQAHLANQARGYLVPQWRRLTEALTEQTFDPAQPTLHPSYTGIYALDWQGVKQAIEKEPQWRSQPELLLRHVQACARLWQNSDAVLSWFYLCWQFPENTNIDAAQCDRELKNAWLDFLELEPELPAEAFPAWYLLIKPGLVKTLAMEDNAPNNELYEIVHQLIVARQAKDESREMNLRQQLQALNPVFFQLFKKRVTK
jgi:hypothetical protein